MSNYTLLLIADHWDNIPVVSRHSLFGYRSKLGCKTKAQAEIGIGHILFVGRSKNLGLPYPKHIKLTAYSEWFNQTLVSLVRTYTCTWLLDIPFVWYQLVCSLPSKNTPQVGMPRFCFLRIPTKSSIYPKYRTDICCGIRRWECQVIRCRNF